MIEALRGLIRQTAASTGFLGEVGVLLMFAHMAFDMVLRFVTGMSPDGMPEAVSRLYMVMVVFLPLAVVQQHGQQIEVSFFAERFRGKAAWIARVLAPLATAGVAALLTWLSFGVALSATTRGEHIMLISGSLPIWPARWAVVLGFGALGLVALGQTLSALAGGGRVGARDGH